MPKSTSDYKKRIEQAKNRSTEYSGDRLYDDDLRAIIKKTMRLKPWQRKVLKL